MTPGGSTFPVPARDGEHILMIDESATRKEGELWVGGRVRPCIGACVKCGKLYVFKQDVPAVKYRGRVYVVARDSDLLAEVL